MASVMIVDDEDVLVALVAELIEDIGHRALIATNGQEALATLHTEHDPPALIISDVMMPQMSGIALARAVRDDPRLQHIPIVLMSAAGKPPQASVADHFLHKPFDMYGLERLIEQYVGTA